MSVEKRLGLSSTLKVKFSETHLGQLLEERKKTQVAREVGRKLYQKHVPGEYNFDRVFALSEKIASRYGLDHHEIVRGYDERAIEEDPYHSPI